MNFITIFGPSASGKMTVGAALARQSGLKLFHNHMTIEVVLPFFAFGEPAFHRLVGEFRKRIFEEVASSALPGMIFTYLWALDLSSDHAFIASIRDIFRSHGAQTGFVELSCPLQERLVRNRGADRLALKPSKRDLETSERLLLEDESRYRMQTAGDFPWPDEHLRLENRDLTPDQAATLIRERFQLPLGSAFREKPGSKPAIG